MEEKPHVNVLLVSRNLRNLELLNAFLCKEGYTTLMAKTLEEFDQCLSAPFPIGLTLLDVAGFDRPIWKRCEQLREKKIPFIVISPNQSAAIQQISITYGAKGVMVKPLLKKDLLTLLTSMLHIDGQEEFL